MKSTCIETPIEIKPGRTYVLETEQHLTEDDALAIKNQWRDVTDSTVVILAGGLKLARKASWLRTVISKIRALGHE